MLKTQVKDLSALLAFQQADREEKENRRALTEAVHQRFPDLPAVEQLAKAQNDKATTTDATYEQWMKCPADRRNLAQAIEKSALTEGLSARLLGDTYSGETQRSTRWDDKAAAWTDVSRGEQYSRSCTFKKTDAHHQVTLDPAGAPLLLDHRDLVRLSRHEGLPLIALYPLTTKEARKFPGTFRAVWVRTKAKQIVSEEGWIAWNGDLCFHSTKTAEHAFEGYQRKQACHEVEERARHLQRKERRRAALVARLCQNVKATLADARDLGFCEPGIQAFQERHGIGNEASLSDLLKTGDPSAVRLALAVARKVKRGEKAAA